MEELIMEDALVLAAGVSAGVFLAVVRRRIWGAFRRFGSCITRAVRILFSVSLMWRKKKSKISSLKEALREAEMKCSGFSRSLGEAEKILESILASAERTAQSLQKVLVQAAAAKTDQYSTAAFLFSQNKKPEEVARVLKLPLSQVRLIQELRQAVETKGEPVAVTEQKKSLDPKGQGTVSGPTEEKAATDKGEKPNLEEMQRSLKSQQAIQQGNGKQQVDSQFERKENPTAQRRGKGAGAAGPISVRPVVKKQQRSRRGDNGAAVQP